MQARQECCISINLEKLLRDSLTTAGALTPLSARTVNVYTEYSNVFRQYDVLNVITDQDGYFRTTMQIDNLSHWNKFIAAFYKGEKQRITSRIQITYMRLSFTFHLRMVVHRHTR